MKTESRAQEAEISGQEDDWGGAARPAVFGRSEERNSNWRSGRGRGTVGPELRGKCWEQGEGEEIKRKENSWGWVWVRSY